jgi:trehalose-phosphatase
MTSATPADVAAAVGDVRDRLVVLDFDGTLSPIVEHPEDAALAPGAYEAITALCEHTDVAVVTGRPIEDVLPRLRELPVTVVGNHGTEVRHRDGTLEPLFDTSRMGDILDEVEGTLARLVHPADGWQVERKPTSVAVHDRRVAAELREALLPKIREGLRRHTDRPPGWKVLAGHHVTEFAPSSADKGTALRWLLTHLDRDDVVVVGDDVTDEDAFLVAEEIGGLAVVITEDARASAASLRLHDPAAVVAMLELLGHSTATV